jgi:hypothetical protein
LPTPTSYCSAHVDRYINYYIANGIGDPVDKGPQFSGVLQNVDLEHPGVSIPEIAGSESGWSSEEPRQNLKICQRRKHTLPMAKLKKAKTDPKIRYQYHPHDGEIIPVIPCQRVSGADGP